MLPAPQPTARRGLLRRVLPDQDPPATDVLLHLVVPCSGGTPARLEIDKLADGRYRATVGTMFEHQEIIRTRALEALVRQANVMAGCRSFDDLVHAFRAENACVRWLGRVSAAQKKPPEGGPGRNEET